MMTNLETIRKALEIEKKHNYINIQGRTCPFSRFIIEEARKNGWQHIYELFKSYSTSDVSGRMGMVRQLIKHLNNQAGKTRTDVTYVKGVGPRIGALLNKMGIFTASDLLHYYPRKHLNYANRTPIRDLVIGSEVTIYGKIISVGHFRSKKNKNLNIFTLNISDNTGVISINRFFNAAGNYTPDRYRAQYPKGAAIIVSGIVKLDEFSGRLTIDNPEMETIKGDMDDMASLHLDRIVPVYTVTENLHVKTLRNAIHNAINLYSHLLEDSLPENIKKKYNLVEKEQAISRIHFPESEDELIEARRRLVFEEFFLMQLRLALTRKQAKTSIQRLSLEAKKAGLVEKFLNSLPFTLTKGQKEAFDEILADIQQPEPMRRLLQGDVGSGKTVVACMALLTAVDNGYQGAIMAPTEILAEQHYRTFTQWLTPLGLSIGLFVGKHGAKTRRELCQNLQNGQINVAVGTHALIQEAVEFKNLGMVIIDEQHRFGVRQRAELKNKGLNPELLTMTATPIPRTLALTIHGDMDVTLINDLPPGRKPVKTALINGRERDKAYSLIRKEIEKGHQAYVVFPLIDESETLSAKAAVKEAEKLETSVFSDLNLGLVHGKMSPVEKDRVMEEFRAGKYNILVSTTVIEVGVDVPNATVMMIENSERFGLSQLHQLRGRVGRGKAQAYCVLVADTNSPDTRERLEVMTQTNNGFVIAESDLKIRGPGEMLGTRQSGLPDLILADIVNDAGVLEIAREAAFDFVENEKIEDYPALNKLILSDGVEIEF